MNRVAPLPARQRGQARRPLRPGGNALGSPPLEARAAGRGRSVGSSQRRGARPAAPASRRAAAPAPRPRSHSRCQTAKSAYWTGSSGSGEGGSRERGAVEGGELARPARPSTSRRRRCGGWSSSRACSPAAEPQQRGAQQRPALEIERARRLLAGQAPGLASRARLAGRAARSTTAGGIRRRRGDHLHRPAAPAPGRWCAGPRAAARSRPGRRPGPPGRDGRRRPRRRPAML